MNIYAHNNLQSNFFHIAKNVISYVFLTVLNLGMTFPSAVSALKEIVEDWKRHKADHDVNHSKVEVLRNGEWVWIRWADVQVADIVTVKNNRLFPADLLLLSSR